MQVFTQVQRCAWAFTLALIGISATGCEEAASPANAVGSSLPARSDNQPNPAETGHQPVPAGVVADAAPTSPALQMPEVVMTEAHEATCRVKPGEKVPDVTLADLQGNQQQLARLTGERGTVLLFWSATVPYSVHWLEDLAADVDGKYPGVNVVAVNEKDTLEEAQQLAAAARFPILQDPGQAFFHQVATEILPRIYLLGPDREVLWLGIDYQEGTRRDFNTALEFLTK